MRIVMPKKILIPICLLAIISLDLALLLPFYIENEAPIGWDTPVYVALIKTIGEKDVSEFLEEHFYPHLYSFFGFAINQLLIHDPFLTEKILPIAMNIAVVLLFAYIVQRVFKDYKLSMLTAFFSVTSTTLIRMTADLHRNLMGCVFLLSTLLLAHETYKKQSLKRYTLLLISWILLIITHIETAIFFIIAVIMYTVLSLRTRRVGLRKLLINLSWIYVPPILFFLVFYPHSFKFLAHFSSEIIHKQGLAFGQFWQMDDIQYGLGLLGGVNIPFVGLGLFRCLKHPTKRGPYGFLAMTSITALLIAVVFWGLRDRSILFFPSSLLGALGILSIYRCSTLSKMKTDASRSCLLIRNRKGFRKVIISVSIILLISLNIFTAKISAIRWLHPYIENETYENVRWLATRVEDPIVIMYKPESPWAGGTLEMYQDWIEASTGSKYVYAGKLYSLLHGNRTVFEDEYFEKFSTETWNKLVQDNILENLENPEKHPVIILKEFYDSPLTPYEKTLLNEQRPGLYILKSNYTSFTEELYSIRLVAYNDYYDGSYNWYSTIQDWATAGRVFETYDEDPNETFYVIYKVPLFSNISYLIKLRLYDASSYFASVALFFDGKKISEITYGGTGIVIEISKHLGEVAEGVHEFMLRISDLNRPHLLRLDYIDFIPIKFKSDNS